MRHWEREGVVIKSEGVGFYIERRNKIITLASACDIIKLGLLACTCY